MSIKLTSGTTAFTTTTILNSQTSTISLYTANKYIDKDITITVSAKSGSISANTIIANKALSSAIFIAERAKIVHINKYHCYFSLGIVPSKLGKLSR